MFSILNMDVSDRIKQRMRDLNVKAVDIVKNTGASKGSVSQWVNGTSEPSSKNLQALLSFYGVQQNGSYQEQESQTQAMCRPVQKQKVLFHLSHGFRQANGLKQSIYLSPTTLKSFILALHRMAHTLTKNRRLAVFLCLDKN